MAEHQASKRYAVEYRYAGVTWGAEVWADSEEDARKKLRAMASGTVLGEIHLHVRLPNFFGRIARWLGLVE